MKELLDPKTKFSKFDLDKDGVINQHDCNPFDKRKTDFGGRGGRIRTFRGYNIDDYFYDASQKKYVLLAGAEPVKKGWLR